MEITIRVAVMDDASLVRNGRARESVGASFRLVKMRQKRLDLLEWSWWQPCLASRFMPQWDMRSPNDSTTS